MSKLLLLSPPMLMVALSVTAVVATATVTDWSTGVTTGTLILKLFTAYFRSRPTRASDAAG